MTTLGILIDNGSTDRSDRTLSLAERLRVVGRCRRMHGYGPGRWLALWDILALGYAAFLPGRFTRGFPAPGRTTRNEHHIQRANLVVEQLAVDKAGELPSCRFS